MSLLTSARKASASSLSALEEAGAVEREEFAVAGRAEEGGGGGLVDAEETGREEFGAGGGFFPAARTR